MKPEVLRNKLEQLERVLTPEEESKLIDEWLEFDGEKAPFVIMEECAELAQVVSKYDGRKHESMRLNLIEEMADVQIVLEFCKRRYNISEDELDRVRTVKLDREKEI